MTATTSLTIFAIPKRFAGHFGLIQRNAIRSWAALSPRPEIILLGSDEGTDAMAAEVGARHLPDVAASPAGAPMLDDVFAKAQQQARTPLVCFVNADIVLTPQWLRAVETVAAWRPSFLMVGRRWNLDVLAPLEMGAGWVDALIADATARGTLAENAFIDYFVFPRRLLAEVPPFVIGRPGYDNWLLWNVRSRGVPLVDATAVAPVIHQNHDYSHIKTAGADPGGRQSYLKGQDTQNNAALIGDWTHMYTIDHATHVLTGAGVRLALAPRYLRARAETARKRLIDVSRPLRRKLGIDAGWIQALRARMPGQRRDS
jgi:hypothetical protein